VWVRKDEDRKVMFRQIHRTTIGLLAGAATLLLAASAVALPIHAHVGSGDASATVIVQFDSGDKFRFAVSFDSGTPTSGLDLMKTIDTEVVGFDIVVLDFGFGEFVDGISFQGNDNHGYVDPDGWWHYWTGDPQTGEWTESQVGAGGRPISDGDWDGWRWGSPNPPSVSPGSQVPALGMEAGVLLVGGLALFGGLRLRQR
jgi:hypothetical protein